MTLILILLSLTVNFEYPEINMIKGYYIPEVPGCINHGTPGSPFLPVKPLFVKAERVKIHVFSRKLPGHFRIMPTPAAVPISHPELFKGIKENPEVYSSINQFPQKPYKILGRRKIAGENFYELLIYPLSYIPGKGELIFNYKFVIEDAVEEKPEIAVPDSYIIITSSALAPYFRPLLSWKKRKGLRAVIVTVEDITSSQLGRDTAEKIRNYLKTHRGYLLLGGDTDIIPARYAYAMDAGTGNSSDNMIPCDLYYSDLDGSWDLDGDGIFGEVEDSVDLIPDLIVGRAPVSTPAQVTNFVNKVIRYERDHATGYFGDGLFLASYLDNVTDGGVAKDGILEIMPDDLSITRLYERFGNLNRNTALYYMGLGFNFINHNGHGNSYLMQVGADYLNPFDFDNLTNTTKITGILYSIGCWTCAFDDNCIAEHFVNSPGGGFYIGNSRYGWYIPGFPGFSSSDLFDRKFFEILDNGETKPGKALAMAKLYFTPISRSANDYRWNEYTLTYLGDPEMDVFMKNPESLVVRTPEVLQCGENTFSVYVKDQNNLPIAGVSIAVLQGDSLIKRSFTDENGVSFFNLTISGCDSIHISVFKAGYTYQEATIPVQPSSLGVEIVDFGNDAFEKYFVGGSSDTMNVKIRNASGTTLRNIGFAISATGIIHPSLDTVFIDSIPAGDTALVTIPMDIDSVNADTLTSILFDSTTLDFEVLRKRVLLAGYDYTFLQRNSSGYLTLKITDPLPVPVKNVNISMKSLDRRVELSDTLVLLGNVVDTAEVTVIVNVGSFPDTLFFPRIMVLNDTITLSVGYRGYEFSFEAGPEGWIVENGYWHITSHRSSSGNYSFYVGNEGSYRYSPGFVASLISPPLTVPDGGILRFDTYYETQPGWDFCMVEAISLDTFHIATYGGPSQGWQTYEYDLTHFSPGSTVRLKFTFYSENNDIQLEGWYIDNVSLTRRSVATGVKEREKPVSGYTTCVVTGNKSFYTRSPGQYIIMDVTGRVRREVTGSVINFDGLPSGIYFIAKKGPKTRILARVSYVK